MMNVIMLNVTMLNAIMMNIIMLNVIMMNVIMMNVIMLNVIMMSVVMLNMIVLMSWELQCLVAQIFARELRKDVIFCIQIELMRTFLLVCKLDFKMSGNDTFMCLYTSNHTYLLAKIFLAWPF
jgi:hypothetical protein